MSCNLLAQKRIILFVAVHFTIYNKTEASSLFHSQSIEIQEMVRPVKGRKIFISALLARRAIGDTRGCYM